MDYIREIFGLGLNKSGVLVGVFVLVCFAGVGRTRISMTDIWRDVVENDRSGERRDYFCIGFLFSACRGIYVGYPLYSKERCQGLQNLQESCTGKENIKVVVGTCLQFFKYTFN